MTDKAIEAAAITWVGEDCWNNELGGADRELLINDTKEVIKSYEAARGGFKGQLSSLDFENDTATFKVPDKSWIYGEYTIIPPNQRG